MSEALSSSKVEGCEDLFHFHRNNSAREITECSTGCERAPTYKP